MNTVCPQAQCVGCMACADVCPHHAITVLDSITHYDAIIDSQKCIGCDACHRICQNNRDDIVYHTPLSWYEGWAVDEMVRAKGSSGGVATALSLAFVKAGGVVCSCTVKDGSFCFALAETPEEVEQFTGSKYVKSNPEGVYGIVNNALKAGKKVLFIGLPCQVSALKLVVPNARQEGLYTIDLICHGTPSPQLLHAYFQECGATMASSVVFREKHRMNIQNEGRPLLPRPMTDRYTLAFLVGLCYTENCYSCSYAKEERVSDLTLGDSWGSTRVEEEQEKGISLVLCNTERGQHLLEQTPLTLHPADRENAIASNHQLEHPSVKHPKRATFFAAWNKRHSFGKAVRAAMPISCMKQTVKRLLWKLHVKR